MNDMEANIKTMETKKYFERRAIDNPDLGDAIPELLRVIDDLRKLRKSKRQTDDYINKWRKTKYKEYLHLPDENGTIVECFNNNPDMFTHDRFINWLFDYFKKLYEKKTGKTIVYAYALDILTVYHNQQLLNKRRFGNEIERPNTNIDDVLDALEAEEAQQTPTLTSQPEAAETQKANTGKPQLNFTDYLHHSNKEALMKKLHELLHEQSRAKEVAITIQSLAKLSFIVNYGSKNNLYAAMKQEFNFHCSNSGINNFLNSNNKKLTGDDIESTTKILNAVG